MRRSAIFLILSLLPLLSIANPPPAKAVFQLSAKRLDPNTFLLEWHIKKGFFLYKNRISLQSSKENTPVHIAPLHLPKGLKKRDKQGKIELIYRHQLLFPVSVLGEEPGENIVYLHYQGCSDDGFCYPPVTKAIKLTVDTQLALSSLFIEPNEQLVSLSPPVFISEKEKLAHLFSTHNWAFILLSFFGFGLLLAFTPCVLPMIPVLSGIIIGHGKDLSTRKAFFLSLSYVLSMSFTYAIAGAIVALMGKNLQLFMQSPWAISLFSALFVLLSLSMFNVYEFRLPLSWQTKLAQLSRHQGRGHYLSSAFMGAFSTLILSPCVTPPLIGALGYIAQTGSSGLGSLALFFLSLGMGTPLLMIGTSAGHWLPRAGQWMNTVKALFGIMLLAIAITLLDRIISSIITMILWAGLSIFSGLYMGAFMKARSLKEKSCQGLGLLLLVYGVLILVGASQGHTNPLQPLAPLPTQNVHPSNLILINTLQQAEKALADAKGKPVMLDFYADWCASCKILEATTLKRPQIQDALSHFIVLKIDLTANNANTAALLRHFNVVAPPTFIFFNAQGNSLDALQLVGEVSANVFYAHLKQVLLSR